MQRDDWYSSKRDPADFAAPEAIGDYAARRALSRLGARKLKTCQVPVLFEAPLAAIADRQLRPCRQRRHALPQVLLPARFARHADLSRLDADRPKTPTCRKGLASSSFDDDGVATHDRDVVRDGVLQGYFLSTYSARKLGMQTTGNAGGSHNLIVTPSPDAPTSRAC